MADRASTARNDLTGFVLAGGVSRRMGHDKAEIAWDGGTLLTHAVEQMMQVAVKVFVVGAAETEHAAAPVLRDVFPGLGPLAGIHAALAHTETDWNLVLAVDLPLVTARMLALIADSRASASALAVFPRVRSRLQPLCAAYHRDLLPEIERALASQELSIHRLLEPLSTRIIEEDQLIANGFVPEMLLNVNTPQDLDRARAIAKTMHG